MKKLKKFPITLPLSPRQQQKFYAASLTLVFCDVEARRVYISDGKTFKIIAQDTRESTRQRASTFLSPRFIVFSEMGILPKSKQFLIDSGLFLDIVHVNSSLHH